MLPPGGGSPPGVPVLSVERLSRPVSRSGQQEAGPAPGAEFGESSIAPNDLLPRGQLRAPASPVSDSEEEEDSTLSPADHLESVLSADGCTAPRKPGEAALTLSPWCRGWGLLGPQSDLGRGIAEIVGLAEWVRVLRHSQPDSSPSSVWRFPGAGAVFEPVAECSVPPRVPSGWMTWPGVRLMSALKGPWGPILSWTSRTAFGRENLFSRWSVLI